MTGEGGMVLAKREADIAKIKLKNGKSGGPAIVRSAQRRFEKGFDPVDLEEKYP